MISQSIPGGRSGLEPAARLLAGQVPLFWKTCWTSSSAQFFRVQGGSTQNRGLFYGFDNQVIILGGIFGGVGARPFMESHAK